LDKDKYKLRIMKPDFNYLIKNSESSNEISHVTALKAQDDEQLERVMA